MTGLLTLQEGAEGPPMLDPKLRQIWMFKRGAQLRQTTPHKL